MVKSINTNQPLLQSNDYNYDVVIHISKDIFEELLQKQQSILKNQHHMLESIQTLKNRASKSNLNRIEAAGRLGISPSTFDKLVKAGLITPTYVSSGRKVYPEYELDNYLDNQQQLNSS